MALRKNTAEAFEILHRLAKEAEARRQAGSAPGENAAGPEAGRAPAPKLSGAEPATMRREPLLKAPRASQGRVLGAKPSADGDASGRRLLGRPAGEWRSTPKRSIAARAEVDAAVESRRGGSDALLARLSGDPRPPAPVRPAAAANPDDEWTAHRERRALLEEPRSPWAAPGLPGVDPVLVRGGDLETIADARRVDLLEAREPLPPRHAVDPAPRVEEAAVGTTPDGGEQGPSGGKQGPKKGEKDPRGGGSGRRSQKRGRDATRADSGAEARRDTAPEASRDWETRVAAAESRVAPEPLGQALPLAETPRPEPIVEAASQASLGLTVGGRLLARARRGIVWALGPDSSKLLERRLDLKLSTLLVFAMAGVVVITLILTYLRMPGEEDALYRSTLRDPAADGAAVSPASGKTARDDAVPRSPSQSGGVKRFPLWSPVNPPFASAPGTGAGRPVELPPEIRNVETASPGAVGGRDAGAELARGAAVGAQRAAQEPASPFVYMIQVRAKESMAGAQSIVDYLSLFGFDKPLIEGGTRGERNGAGEKLYTVFVGEYFNEAEARRECQRLKAETHERPYKSKEDFFEGCLVITRKR